MNTESLSKKYLEHIIWEIQKQPEFALTCKFLAMDLIEFLSEKPRSGQES